VKCAAVIRRRRKMELEQQNLVFENGQFLDITRDPKLTSNVTVNTPLKGEFGEGANTENSSDFLQDLKVSRRHCSTVMELVIQTLCLYSSKDPMGHLQVSKGVGWNAGVEEQTQVGGRLVTVKDDGECDADRVRGVDGIGETASGISGETGGDKVDVRMVAATTDDRDLTGADTDGDEILATQGSDMVLIGRDRVDCTEAAALVYQSKDLDDICALDSSGGFRNTTQYINGDNSSSGIDVGKEFRQGGEGREGGTSGNRSLLGLYNYLKEKLQNRNEECNDRNGIFNQSSDLDEMQPQPLDGGKAQDSADDTNLGHNGPRFTTSLPQQLVTHERSPAHMNLQPRDGMVKPTEGSLGRSRQRAHLPLARIVRKPTRDSVDESEIFSSISMTKREREELLLLSLSRQRCEEAASLDGRDGGGRNREAGESAGRVGHHQRVQGSHDGEEVGQVPERESSRRSRRSNVRSAFSSDVLSRVLARSGTGGTSTSRRTYVLLE